MAFYAQPGSRVLKIVLCDGSWKRRNLFSKSYIRDFDQGKGGGGGVKFYSALYDL